MAGDGKNTDDITIPMLFLFNKEGNIILDALQSYESVEVLLSDKAKDRATIFKDKTIPNYIIDSNLEMEAVDQMSSDNDSHNQKMEEISADLNLVSQESEEEVGTSSFAESDSNSFSQTNQDSCTPEFQQASSSSQAAEEDNNHPEEQSKIETDSSPSNNWSNKDQSMESILADWNEDIEAFEMMEKDEL
ncbi:PREDICTED: ER degradation-enhancing alpha-mannosidase-like protein 3 [Thamnophis sirtalis]|uniref:ER degradation-enhancing alpha-mannosidase-like protein 3 n=1 Tax=Thamnophis sirtalis TaxID=35019 RepID=A0A6I9Y9X6_9SAUR|nr:PREDICTED: ER degradation-enhancing alpha-mannosidase-like protein 3 [Thamnophis sirtalis]